MLVYSVESINWEALIFCLCALLSLSGNFGHWWCGYGADCVLDRFWKVADFTRVARFSLTHPLLTRLRALRSYSVGSHAKPAPLFVRRWLFFYAKKDEISQFCHQHSVRIVPQGGRSLLSFYPIWRLPLLLLLPDFT